MGARKLSYHFPFLWDYKEINSVNTGLPNRHESTNEYRYGYQGSEKDDEIKGEGNSYTTYFRQLDPKVGRWLSIDPKATAWESPYVSMGNSPIMVNDIRGDFIPLIIGGYYVAAEVVAFFAVSTVVVATVISQDLANEMSNNYPKPWYTDRPRIDILTYNNNRSTPPGGGGGPKLSKWIVGTGMAVSVIKKIYDMYDEPIPEIKPNVEGSSNQQTIISSDGLPKAFIDVNVSNAKDIGNNEVEVTVKADVIIQIEKGDNLTNLAKKHNVTVEQLVQWNNIKNPNLIIEGNYLKVNETTETKVFKKENESVTIESNKNE